MELIFYFVLFNMYTNISISSFNCKGHGDDRLEYIEYLTRVHGMLLLQEHWYHDHGINLLSSRIDNVQVYGASDMDQSESILGRSYGGCAILVKSSIKCKLIPIYVNKGCYCIVLEMLKLLIFNIHMYML